uniref:Uncharacterized protein n=1 Tax=Octopus bimaculoides TaxID=37653 RepID=A0A0L8H4L1_OCTBM
MYTQEINTEEAWIASSELQAFTANVNFHFKVHIITSAVCISYRVHYQLTIMISVVKI